MFCCCVYQISFVVVVLIYQTLMFFQGRLTELPSDKLETQQRAVSSEDTTVKVSMLRHIAVNMKY